VEKCHLPQISGSIVGQPSLIGKVRLARQNEAAGAADAAVWAMSAVLDFLLR
jgi:hypothetical protein